MACFVCLLKHSTLLHFVEFFMKVWHKLNKNIKQQELISKKVILCKRHLGYIKSMISSRYWKELILNVTTIFLITKNVKSWMWRRHEIQRIDKPTTQPEQIC